MGSPRKHYYIEETSIVQDTAIKQDALLRQIEALDRHIDRASSEWSRETFKLKREQLLREWRLCRVIKERK